MPFVRVPDHYSGDGILEKIRMIAAAAGAHERGECLATQVTADLAALAQAAREDQAAASR